MLIKKSLKTYKESVFVCDRCKIEVKTPDRILIYTARGIENVTKKYDLCIKCYRSFCKGVEKGTENK